MNRAGLSAQIRALRQMTVHELRERYAAVFGEECRSRHKQFLFRRIAWGLQAQAQGGLSERARRRAEELARESDFRMLAPRQVASGGATSGSTVTREIPAPRDERLPMPGTVLTREYRGQVIRVTVLDRGFEHDGEVYRSLTAVARAVTGSHWNGYLFFGMQKGGGSK